MSKKELKSLLERLEEEEKEELLFISIKKKEMEKVANEALNHIK